MTPPERSLSHPRAGAFWLALFCLLATLFGAGTGRAEETAKRPFSIGADLAEASLMQFAAQSHSEVLFATRTVGKVRTNEVRGEFTAEDALGRILAGTGLVAEHDPQTGTWTISSDPNAGRAALPSLSRRPPESLSPSARDETIELSPFEVNSSRDVGYQARSTLSGTRLNTDLKDVASEVSVMTPEFLSDVGAVTLQDAMRYSLNVENSREFSTFLQDQGQFYQGINNPTTGTRIRGLVAPGQTHDFFTTITPIDTYNTERFTFASGPNSVLYGLGNPAGAIDTSFKRAHLDRLSAEVQVRADSEHSLRGSLDVNAPLIRDHVALRVALLRDNSEMARKPNFSHDKRSYLALTVSPFAGMEVHAWLENLNQDRMPLRNTVIYDAVTPWLAAGKPLVNNAAGVTLPVNGPVFNRDTIARPVFILGAASATPVPFTSWGGNHAVVSNGPQAALTGPDATQSLSLADGSIFPLGNNPNGTGLRDRIVGRIEGVLVEQRIGKNFVVEAGFNQERTDNRFTGFVNGQDTTLKVDANRYLPDGVTANPNVGRYYLEGFGRAGYNRDGRDDKRITASYDLDLRDVVSWLGHHRFAAYAGEELSFSGFQGRDARIINSDATYGTDVVNTMANPNRNPQFRFYLSNPRDPNSGGTYSIQTPFDPFTGGTIQGVQFATFNNPYGAPVQTALSTTRVDSLMVASQNYFLNDHVVGFVGLRRDTVRVASVLTPALGTASTSSYEDLEAVPVPHNWLSDNHGNTSTYGVVVHATSWLSGHFSSSGTYSPTQSSRYPDGSFIPGATGRGYDTGLTLSTPDESLQARFNYFENSVGPASSLQFATHTLVLDPVGNIEIAVRDAGGPASSYVPQNQITYYGLTSNQRAHGLEIEVVGNPTRGLRLAVSAAQTRAAEADVGTQWIDFVRARLPVWSQYANAPVPNPGSGGQATPAGDTVRAEFLTLLQNLNLMQQANGRAAEQLREWRVNGTSRYSFSEGPLRGAYIGGVAQWRSRCALGYMNRTVPNEFPFPGIDATVTVPDIDHPIYSGSLTTFDGFCGYERRLGVGATAVRWKLQLNVRNVFDRAGRIPQQLLSTGGIAKYTLPDPRTFVVTNTWSF